MRYETKTALVLRSDLLAWQVANVAAFLTGGLAGVYPEIVGEPYADASGQLYTPLVREPIFVYGASTTELQRTDQLDLVGIGLHADRKTIDKVINGLKFLP